MRTRRMTVDVPIDIVAQMESHIGRFDKEYRSKQAFILDAIVEKLSDNFKESSVETTEKNLKTTDSSKSPVENTEDNSIFLKK